MIKHIVFWKIHQNGTESVRKETFHQFENMINDLSKVIPQIVEARVGYNFQADNNYHICIDAIFNSRADLDTYIKHPDHLKVRKFLDSCQFEKTIFDYEF